MNTWRFTCIKIWVQQLLIGNTTNVVSPRKTKTVPITSAFPLQLWPPHMGNKLACESKTRNWETLATSISKHDRCILNDEVCCRKPSKIWCGAFARGTFWWIHTWLQKFSTFLKGLSCYSQMLEILAYTLKWLRWSWMSSWCCDVHALNNAIDWRKLVSLQASSQQLKFTTSDSCDRIKDEFQFLQAQYHRCVPTLLIA